MISRRKFCLSFVGLCAGFPSLVSRTAHAARLPADPWAERLIAAAKAQVGVTLSYDPNYRRISFPGGDVPREIGVCTDVIIRAYRDSLNVDLQKLVNTDMKKNFAAYPKIWGLRGTDTNIDHRRVPNLRTFLKRKGAEQDVSANPADYLPGDIVTQKLPGNLAHIVLVSNEMNADQTRPLVIHNIGRGAQIEDTLFAFEITGHYRYAA